jgi:hypothetical protein
MGKKENPRKKQAARQSRTSAEFYSTSLFDTLELETCMNSAHDASS